MSVRLMRLWQRWATVWPVSPCWLTRSSDREILTGLILIGTGSGGPAFTRASGSLANASHPAFPQMAMLGMPHMFWPRRAPYKMMLNFVQRQSFVDRCLAQPELLKLSDWWSLRQGRSDWQWIARNLDYAPRLKEIQVPTLLLCGRHDPPFPLSASQALSAAIPDSRLCIFEHSRHYPFIEEAQAFWQTVDHFLTART